MVDCPVNKTAHQFGNEQFLIDSEGELSYSAFESLLTNSEAYDKAAFKEKTLFLVPVESGRQSLITLFATMRAGHVAVPVDKNLPAERLAFLNSLYHKQPAASCVADACLGIFTSGSTGRPKLVLHSWASLLCNAKASNQLIPLKKADRTLISLPLYHIGGFAQVVRAIVSGTTIVIGGRVESAEVLNSNNISHSSLVSTQLRRLVEQRPSLPQLKSLLVGGGPVDNTLICNAKNLGLPVMPTYGMTETASQLITEVIPGKQQLLGDAELKINQQGELCVRSCSLFLGYWEDGRLIKSRDAKGWFRTKDLARYEHSRWHITGRLDNQFVSGGKNIQPEEIEAHMEALVGIEKAVVVPVSHREFGKTAFALLKRSGELAIDSEFQSAIIEQLKSQLPGYLVPRYYAELPQASGVKIKREELIEYAERQKAP